MRIGNNGCLIVAVMLSILCGTIAPTAYADVGDEGQINQVRLLTIEGLDSQVRALAEGQIDFLPNLIRRYYIAYLIDEGFLVTSTPRLHLAFIGFNLKRPYLDDVNLKHALFHAYNQFESVTDIYLGTCQPIQSIVVPAQGEWANPAVPKHPFNPGNVGDLYPAQHTTFSIMAAAGYTYVGTGYGDTNAHWEKDGVPLPTWRLWTPSAGVYYSPAYFHGKMICDEWHRCGFNNIIHEPVEDHSMTRWVYEYHDFDMFMMFSSLSDVPLQLYCMCHSSQYFPGSEHPVGLNDPVLDSLLETVECSLNRTEAVEAAWEAQRLLYDETNPQALPYMALYSWTHFNAAAKNLNGIVNSLSYGSDNSWTWYNWRWNTRHGNRPGTNDPLIVYCNAEAPETLNYLSLQTTYEKNIVKPTQSRGIEVDPYISSDVAWQLEEVPTVTNGGIQGPITTTTPGGKKIVNGMKITYKIRDDIYWQDGNKYDADDAIFSLNFLKNNQIPNYASTWQDIVEIHKNDNLTYEVYANRTSLSLVYSWDKGAFLCPPQVWSWLDGKPLATILSYDLTANATDTGPWSYPLTPNGPKTQLFGTGPFVFDSYDSSGMYADLHRWDTVGINKGYFKTTTEIADTLTDLFHKVGDVDRDGWIWASDMHEWALSYGKTLGTPGYNPNADLNEDKIVDCEDGALIGAFWGKKKEYSQP